MYYIVTLRSVGATIFAVEKQKVLHNLRVCLWPEVSGITYIAHAPCRL
jgi:hypothetical protein